VCVCGTEGCTNNAQRVCAAQRYVGITHNVSMCAVQRDVGITHNVSVCAAQRDVGKTHIVYVRHRGM